MSEDDSDIGAIRFSLTLFDENKANNWLENRGFKTKYYNKPPQYSCRYLYYLQKCPNRYSRKMLYETIEDGIDIVWFFKKTTS
jgi:hypothetical protein